MSLFSKKKEIQNPGLGLDMHSHLIPGIDDGSQSLEQSLEMIQYMTGLGYQKIITTPHIITGLYPNSPGFIVERFEELKKEVVKAGLPVDLQVAAEHYLDEFLLENLEIGNVLLMNKEYILFETSFMSKPVIFEDFIFKAISKGLKPIMAHPERYIYFQNNWDLVGETIERGVLFQINISSLTGFYSKPARNLAEKLINNRWVHFLGTDAHSIDHLVACKEAFGNKFIQKALKLPLLNSALL